jgi:hypothetical protein
MLEALQSFKPEYVRRVLSVYVQALLVLYLDKLSRNVDSAGRCSTGMLGGRPCRVPLCALKVWVS